MFVMVVHTINYKPSVYLFCVLDVSDSVANCRDFLCLIVRDVYAKLLLELHDELNCVERVCTEVVCEACFWLNVCLIYTEFVNDNSLYF